MTDGLRPPQPPIQRRGALGPRPTLGAGSRVRRSREPGSGLSGLGGAGLGARHTDDTGTSDRHWAQSPRRGVRPQVWGTSSVRLLSLPTPAANRGPREPTLRIFLHPALCPLPSVCPSLKVGLLCSPEGACPACPSLASAPGPGSHGFALEPHSPTGHCSGSQHRLVAQGFTPGPVT